jgi:hypothetical protein
MLFLWDFFMLNARRGYFLADYAVPKQTTEPTTRV